MGDSYRFLTLTDFLTLTVPICKEICNTRTESAPREPIPSFN